MDQHDYMKELDELLNKFDQKELVENQEIIKLKTINYIMLSCKNHYGLNIMSVLK